MAISADKNYINRAVNDGLSIAQIAKCLRRSTQDLGQLAGDITPSGNSFVRVNRINKWAKYKPYRSHLLDTTVNARKAAGYGLSAIQYDGTQDAMTGARGGSDGWIYSPPRGLKNTALNQTNADEYFRILDFDGYNHAAEIPYRIGAVAHPSVLREDKIIDVVRNDDAEIKIEDFPSTVFGDDAHANLDNVYVYLLVFKGTWTSVNAPIICHPTGGDITLSQITSGMNTINFTMLGSSLVTTNDTYNMVAAATTWVESSGDDPEDSSWVLLPGTYQAAVINDQQFFVEMLYSTDKANSFGRTITPDNLNWRMNLRLENDDLGDSADPVELHFEVAKISGGSYEILDSYVVTLPSPLDDRDSATYNLNHNFDIHSAGTQTDAALYLRAYYIYQGANDQSLYQYHRYFEIWRNAGGSSSYSSLTYVPFTSIADILNPPQN